MAQDALGSEDDGEDRARVAERGRAVSSGGEGGDSGVDVTDSDSSSAKQSGKSGCQ